MLYKSRDALCVLGQCGDAAHACAIRDLVGNDRCRGLHADAEAALAGIQVCEEVASARDTVGTTAELFGDFDSADEGMDDNVAAVATVATDSGERCNVRQTPWDDGRGVRERPHPAGRKAVAGIVARAWGWRG